jgi:hypothetical protein
MASKLYRRDAQGSGEIRKEKSLQHSCGSTKRNANIPAFSRPRRYINFPLIKVKLSSRVFVFPLRNFAE